MITTLRHFGLAGLLILSPSLLGAKGCSFGGDDVPLGTNGDAGAGDEGGMGPVAGTGGTSSASGAGGSGVATGGAGNAGNAGSAGMEPEPTVDDRPCLEELTPLEGSELTPLGFSADDAWELISGKRTGLQYLIHGGSSAVEFQMVRAELFYVHSTINPNFTLEIAVSCDDHVRAKGIARFKSSDGSFDETFHDFELGIGAPQTAGPGDTADNLYAGGVISLETHELRGNYRPEIGDDQCYLAMQFNVNFTDTDFTGSLIESILNAPCGDTSPTTAVLSSDAGSWSCAAGCTLQPPEATIVVEAPACSPLDEQVTASGDESAFTRDGDVITTSRSWGGGCPRFPEFMLAYQPSSPLELRLCHYDAADPCEAVGNPTLSFDLATAFEAAGTSEFRFVD